MHTIKYNQNELKDNLPEKYTYICHSSYEERCMTVTNSINPKSVEQAYMLSSKSFENNTNRIEFAKSIENVLGNTSIEKVSLDSERPLSIAEDLTKVIKDILSCDNANCLKKSLVIDVTTFTHESLLMLLRLLYINAASFDSIQCLYNGASSYSGFSSGDSPELVWLSKGCRDIRNVIGYPGQLEPTGKNHLMLLTGFEYERATKLADILNPDHVILGKGDRNSPIESIHADIMDYMNKQFEKWANANKKFVQDTFSFSCSDVEKARDDICSMISDKNDVNYIIAPLNTKISTIAAAVVAFINPKVQICYAVPEVYNSDNYSTPSENVTCVNLHSIFAEIEGRG